MSMICAYILAWFCKIGTGSVGIATGNLKFWKRKHMFKKICKINVYS